MSGAHARAWAVGDTFASVTYRPEHDRRRRVTIRWCTVTRVTDRVVTLEYVRPGALTWSSGWLPDAVHVVHVRWGDVIGATQ